MYYPRKSPALYLPPLVCILLFGFALRLIDSMVMPLFVDEALHLTRAHRIQQGEIFAGLDQNKWFYGFVLSQVFRPSGPEGPWLARTMNALVAAVSMAGVFRLGWELTKKPDANPRPALFAVVIYALLPLAVFHERQALTDPLMAMFVTLALVAAVRMVHKTKLTTALMAGVLFAFARLTKASMVPYFIMPFAAVVLLVAQGKGEAWVEQVRLEVLNLRLRLEAKGGASTLLGIAYAALAVGLALAVTAVVYSAAAATGVAPVDYIRPGLGNTVLATLPTEAGRTQFVNDIVSVLQMHLIYVGPVIIGLVLLGLLWAVLGVRRRETLFLAIPVLGFAFIPIIVDRPTLSNEIATRYLLINMPSLVLLAAFGLEGFFEQLSRRVQPAVLRRLAAPVLLLVTLPSMLYNVTLISSPAEVVLAPYEYRVYFDSINSSLFQVEAMNEVLSIWQEPGVEHVNGYGDFHSALWANALLGPRVGQFVSYSDDDPHQREIRVANWLASGQPVVFIEMEREKPEENRPDNVVLDEVAESESWQGVQSVFQVVGTSEQIGKETYYALGRDPFYMFEDHDALAEYLNAESEGAERAVLVYPANHAYMVEERTDLSVIPLEVSTWPMTPDIAESALEAVLPTSGRVDVVTVDPAVSDPNRLMALALHDRMYVLDGEQFFGLIALRRYFLAAEEPGFFAINGEFENVILLTEIAVPANAPAGGVLPVILRWQTTQSVEDSFVVFAHMVDADGQLVAQHDGVPGNGLLPLTDWNPGDTIDDRFAIRLPAELPPGDYRLRVGLYEPASGLRLRVTAGEGGGDYLDVGRVHVEQ